MRLKIQLFIIICMISLFRPESLYAIADIHEVKGRIVFQSERNGSIFILENGNIKTISKEGGRPKFSIDGKKVFYSNGELYTFSLINNEVKKFLDLGKNKIGIFDVSPDEKKVVFTSFGNLSDKGMVENLYIVNIDETDYKQITFFVGGGAMGAGRPRWSPDGKTIIFEGPEEVGKGIAKRVLYTIQPDGTNLKKIIGSEQMYEASSPNWSFDSKKIVFHGSKKNTDYNRQIFTADADGSNIKQITFNNGQNLYPVYSPDAKQIAYTSYRHFIKKGVTFYRGAEIFVINIDGTNEFRATPPQVVERGLFPWQAIYATDSHPDWHI